MKIQHTALRVLERTSHFLKKGVITERPAWYNPVAVHPTGYDLTKRPKRLETGRKLADPMDALWRQQGDYVKLRMSKGDRKNKNNKIHAVPKIKLLEDKLRDVFYHQHPWEFARPKNLVENSGNDNTKCDWSHMRQLYKPLDGESVVQRTLYLLQENKEKQGQEALFAAYDQARFEFYQLRMADEMSATVLKEELAMCGAVYTSTNMDFGIKKEQETIDQWTHEAADLTKAMDAKKGSARAGPSDGGSGSTIVWEEAFEEVVEEE